MALQILSLLTGWCARYLGRAGLVHAAAGESTGWASPTVDRAEDPGVIVAAAIAPPSHEVQAASMAKRDESNSVMMMELLETVWTAGLRRLEAVSRQLSS